MKNSTKYLLFMLLISITVPLIAQQREILGQSIQSKVIATIFSSDVNPKEYSKNDGQIKRTPSRFVLKQGGAGIPVYEVEVPRATKSQ